MPIIDFDLKLMKSWFDSKNLPLDTAVLDKFNIYHDLLKSWSNRINLISKSDREHIIENHFLDSLGPFEMIPPDANLIDIGSGAGFPGVPLAIVIPTLEVTLLESVHKRALFLRAVRSELGLDRVQIIEKRLEELVPADLYDIATIRALPCWEDFLDIIKKLLKPNGKIVYYKYRGLYEEIGP